MNKTRTQNVIKNMWVGTLFQIISLILGFVSRTIFIKILGKEYLGLNSLFTNILTILSFAELGIGNAIVFSMYKPLTNNDQDKLMRLTNFYKSIYKKIALTIITVGLLITPFLPYIIKEIPDIKESIYLIYIIFLFDTSVSYFFSYRTSIISADQKNYIIITYTHIFKIVQIILQLSLLYYTHNYLLYLFLQVLNTVLTQWFLANKSKKMYPSLAKLDKDKTLANDERKSIFTNVKALFVYKFSSVILNGTDSIIISKYLGLATLGLYSNYYLIVNAVAIMINQIQSAFTSSIGNLIAKEGKIKEKRIFNQLFYFTGFIYTVVGTCLYLLFNDFITLWLGQEYLLSNFVVATIVGHLCFNGMLFATFTYRNTSGEFNHFKLVPVIGAITNIILSIWFAKIMGLGGVFLATIISRLISGGWTDPYIVYKYVFKEPIKDYLVRVVKMIIHMAICFSLTFLITKNIVVPTFLMFVVKAIIVAFLSILFYLLFSFKTEEFIGIKNALTHFIRRKEHKA